MATKAKTLQVKDKEKDDKAADAPEKDSPDAPSPLLDLSDAAVKKMIKQAKKRGFVTFDQLNEVLPSDTTSPEQIEDIMSMLSDMGINVSEAEEADADEEKEEADDDTDNELVEVTQKAVTEVKKSEPGERTDDPVRMYLREMGTVELLSREGEIAIAKRIEAGREAMIAGLCESPLTFQAIIIWRDELNEGKIFLRDIIDLEATYAGPDAKNNMNPAMIAAPVGADGQAAANGEAAPAHVAPPAAPPSATPFRAAPAPGADTEEKDPAAAEGDMDDDEFENQMSLAAIEAELKPKVVETFDKIASEYKKLRRLQEQDIANQLQSESLSPSQERKYKKLKDEIIVEVKSLRLNQARGLSAQLSRLGARSALAQPCLETLRQRLEEFRSSREGPHQGSAPRDPVAGSPDRPRDRRIPQDRARRAEGRARGAPGQEGNGRGELASRDLDRQEIHQPRPAVPRPDPGRQYRPDEGGR